MGFARKEERYERIAMHTALPGACGLQLIGSPPVSCSRKPQKTDTRRRNSNRKINGDPVGIWRERPQSLPGSGQALVIIMFFRKKSL